MLAKRVAIALPISCAGGYIYQNKLLFEIFIRARISLSIRQIKAALSRVLVTERFQHLANMLPGQRERSKQSRTLQQNIFTFHVEVEHMARNKVKN